MRSASRFSCAVRRAEVREVLGGEGIVEHADNGTTALVVSATHLSDNLG